MTFILILTAIGGVGLATALYLMRHQPKGLYICFFTEMWERFSFYGMRALLVFYLTKHFLFEQSDAYGIYGAYLTLIYITPVIGGVLADRIMGQRRAIILGGLLLVAGHGLMAVEGEPAVSADAVDPFVLNTFYLALALIVMGVGFLKSNVTTIVGELYPRTDARRDSAFTYFYVGINAGSFFGALYAGYLGETFGWRYGFGLAGIGMLAGLLVFILGKPLLQGAGEPPRPAALKERSFIGLRNDWTIYLGAALGTLVVWYLVRDQDTVGLLLGVTGAATVAYVLYRSVFTLEAHARDRIFAALFLITMNILFWALFEQAGSSLNVYADEQVDRTIFGSEVPASVFQSLNAMYIIFLGPVFAALWAFLSKRGMDLTAPQKSGLGIVQLGLGYLVLVWGAQSSVGLTPVVFIFLIYLLHTTGELFLSPIGLSAMTRLSVRSMVGLIMGTYFLSYAAGNFVASKIAQATVAPDADVLEIYARYGWIAVAVGVGVVVISPGINWLMHLKTLTDDEMPGMHRDQAQVPVDQMPQGGTVNPAR